MKLLLMKKINIPEHQSVVRTICSKQFIPLKNWEEALEKDGHLIMEGDYGGIIYLTCPVKLIKCSEQNKQRVQQILYKSLEKIRKRVGELDNWIKLYKVQDLEEEKYFKN